MKTLYTVNTVLFNRHFFYNLQVFKYFLYNAVKHIPWFTEWNMQRNNFNRAFYNCSSNFAHGLSLDRGNVFVKSELKLKKKKLMYSLIWLFTDQFKNQKSFENRTLNGRRELVKFKFPLRPSRCRACCWMLMSSLM